MILSCRQQYLYSVFLVITVFIYPCSKSSADYKIVNSFILDGFVPPIPMSYSYEKDSVYLVSRFGAPLSVSLKISPDRFEPGVQNEIKNVIFNGAKVRMMTPLTKQQRTTWIEYISLTSSRFALKYGLKVGSHKREFLKYLGEPRETLENIFKYQTFGEGYKTLTIEFDNASKAKKITWEYYAD